jgi:hypothetical protein
LDAPARQGRNDNANQDEQADQQEEAPHKTGAQSLRRYGVGFHARLIIGRESL